MTKSQAALLSIAVALLAGCAGSGPTTGDEGYVEKYTRTGTNISDRERMGVQTVNVDDLERQSRAANSGTLVRDPAKTH